jgi:hypothetical protein
MTAEVECCCPECGAEFTAKPEGGHRLLSGDATVATDVERVLGGVRPNPRSTAAERRLPLSNLFEFCHSKRKSGWSTPSPAPPQLALPRPP